MDFKELLAALFAGDVLPDDAHDQLTEAYELDLSIPGARVDDLTAQLAAKDAEITALKLRNYELLEAGNGDAPADKEDNDVDTDITTEDLFTDPDEDEN